MKTTFLFVSLFSYVFFAAADLDPVLDVSNDKLLTGVDYFIIPIYGGKGGITLASVRNKTCSLDVAQDQSLYEEGLWLTIHPINIKKGVSGRVIRESTDLTIRFSSTKTCAKSTIWKVDKYDKLRKRYFVTVGGVEGDDKSQNGWFRIQKERLDYKIVYCSQVQCISAPCDVMCKNVGAYYEHGRSLVALTDQPFVVFFEKVIKG
ncbi:kunitz trypsin inhibitor 5-like [Apium graveolens]|uniref:kunitz trypsin inhibitor 5-like n=1 Tax=Apium graveolens TaxID=4045 RepID=UPI003D79CA36